MSWDDDDLGIGVSQRIDHKLHAQRELLVGISRAVDKLAGRRGGVEERATPGTPPLIQRIVAHIVARSRREEPDAALRRLYPDIRTKAATNPGMTTVPGWAQELTGTGNSGLLPVLAPASGYAQLVPRGVRVNLSGRGTTKLPQRTAGVLPVKFIGEGQPIPVGAAGLANVTLATHKIGIISYFSEELSHRSVPAIESVIWQTLSEDAGKYLDSILLGSTAESVTQPGGLFAGVTPSTGAAGGGQAAVAKDVGMLVDAIAPAVDPALVANASTAARLSVWAPALALPVIVSEAMADNALGAIDSAAFASGEGDAFGIATGVDAVLHSEDTTPLPIGTPGSPATVAAPSVSLFQSDLIAIRLVAQATWQMRATNKVALVTAISW